MVQGKRAFLRGTFALGRRIILNGEISRPPFEKEMIHPDYEILDDNEDQLLNFKRIVPVYSETEDWVKKALRRIMWQVVRDYAHLLRNPALDEISRKRRLMDTHEALRQVHFPDANQEIQAYQENRSDAHRTLIYREFFYFQLGLAFRRSGRIIEEGISFKIGGGLRKRFMKYFPLPLRPLSSEP